MNLRKNSALVSGLRDNSRTIFRWRAGLTAAGVFLATNLFAAPCDPSPPGLISWWRAEGNAIDVVNGNNGTLNGGAGYSAGEVGEAFSFNGTNGFVQVPDAPSLDFGSNAQFTVEFWAQRTGPQTSMGLIGKRTAGCGALQYEVSFNPFGGLTFYGGNGSVSTGAQMPTNVWMHLAATFDGTNTFKFYTNGTLAGTETGNLGAANNAPFTIGVSGGCYFFAGLIDEVSLYGQALSAAEIQAIYAAGSAGKCFTVPSITNQPAPVAKTVLAGENVTYTVGTSGSSPLAYQWTQNTTNISGATNSALVLTNVQTNETGSYGVIVSNYAGAVASSNVTLTVVAPVPGEVVVFDQAGLLSGMSGGGNVTFAGSGTLTLTEPITVTQDISLDAGSNAVILSGGNDVQLFYVNPGVNFTLNHLTIANGSAVGTNTASIPDAWGGAISNNAGNVSLFNCVILSNTCTGGIGAVETPAPPGGNAWGGAIFNNGGTLMISNTALVGNHAIGGLGGWNPVTETSGTGGNATGGAIYNAGGSVFITGSSFTTNGCVDGGAYESGDEGGVWADAGIAAGGAFAMGTGSVVIASSGFYSNYLIYTTADEGYNQYGSYEGGAVFEASGTMNLSNVTFGMNVARGGNSGPAFGGAAFLGGGFDATNCVFTGNLALGGTLSSFCGPAYGGALYNAGAANVGASSFFRNSAIGGSYINSQPAYGGAIFNSNNLVLTASTIASNTATGGSDIRGTGGAVNGSGALGGGIYNIGTMYGTNDTISSNGAVAGSGGGGGTSGTGIGGGLFNQGGAVTLAYLTVTGNQATGSPGVAGGIDTTNGSLYLRDSIVANNAVGGDFYTSYGSLIDGGDNLSSDYSATLSGPGSDNGVNPLLGTLGNYGGPTLTIPLLAGSPAIGAGGIGGNPATDQRGVARPFGGGCDIGAYEFTAATVFGIQGQITGSINLGGILVSAGTSSTATDSNGNYTFGGLSNGTYQVTPASAGVLFVPGSQSVSVGPSAGNINFTGYAADVISIIGGSNGAMHVAYVGTNQQFQLVVQMSSNLQSWIPLFTNSAGSNGFFDFYLTNNPAMPREFFRMTPP